VRESAIGKIPWVYAARRSSTVGFSGSIVDGNASASLL
jgi:hypothetical protein